MRFGSVCLLTFVAGSGYSVVAFANPTFLAASRANTLDPGSYIWEPQPAMSGRISMVVDLSAQRAFVYRSGKLIGISTISSGKPGHETPDGTFTVLQKDRMHHSNKYEDAPMPFMERLGWDGLALHGGHPGEFPASHGCVRLPMGFAAALFKENTRGMQVVITGAAPSRAEILAARDTRSETGTLRETNFWNSGAAIPQQPSSDADSCAAARLPDSDSGASNKDQGGCGENQDDVDHDAPAQDDPSPPS
jgi:hypothetical protein